MKFTVYNIKGGVGKTNISLNLALTMDMNIITNDSLSPIDEVLGENEVLKLEPDQQIEVYADELDIIFDLGGYLDKRAIPALQQSCCVVVPVIGETIDLKNTVNYIQHIEEWNKNIIVVANKTQKGDYEIVKEVIESNYPNYPVLEIKYTRALPNILKEKKSVHEMAKESRLNAYMYSKVVEQFDHLIATISKFAKK